jgi:endonuclease/exonuclease/phosphatase family metal-dependent hydrolase
MLFLLLSYLNLWVPPKLAGIFVFTGLFYPWLLLFNVIFTIYWITDRAYFFVFPLIVICIGYNEIRSIIGFGGIEKGIRNSSELVVLSHNLHYLKDFYRQDRLMEGKELVNRMKSSEADILCFQEFPRYLKNPLELPNRIIKETEFQYFKRFEGSDLYIFSKYPLKESGGNLFSNRVNGYQVVDVKLPNGVTIKIFNVHFASNGVSVIADKLVKSSEMEDVEKVKSFFGMLRHYRQSAIRREQQGEEVLKKVNGSPLPVIVAGDFNEVPQSYLISRFRNTLTDSFASKGKGFGFSYNGRFPALKIDYIFATKNLNILHSRVIPSDFSDHRQVLTIFEIK